MDVHCRSPGAPPTVALLTCRVSVRRDDKFVQGSGGWQWALTELATLCRRGQSPWLVCRDLYQSLTRIHFMDALQAGGWSIKRTGKRAAGLIVHQSGCCYLIAHREGGGKITCVDPINYGVAALPGWSDAPTANVELLMEWWMDWLAWCETHDAGSLRLTLAAQSHYCYRKRFMSHNIVVHNHKQALTLEQDALHGGRCEAYRIGRIDGPVFHVDARSLYGAVAEGALVPTTLIDYGEDGRIENWRGKGGLVADVTVRLDAPAVPYRAKLLTGVEPDQVNGDDRRAVVRPQGVPITVYPTGTFRTSLCGPELDLIHDHIIKVHRWAIYRTAPIFSKWARWNWDRRQEAVDDCGSVVAGQLKQWSQYCYGKWAARYRGWLVDDGSQCIDPWELWWQWDRERMESVPHRSIAGRCEIYEDRGLAASACPVIAAWIASLARVWLEVAIRAAGRENVYYVDTDSVMVNADGLSRLQASGYSLGDDLGSLRLCGEYRYVEIRGWKHYVADGALTCAGVPLSRRGGLIDHVANEAAEPLTVAAISGRPPREAAPLRQWHRSSLYRHGLVQADGTVRPHHLGDRP